MPWLNHPSYVRACNKLVARLKNGSHRLSSRAPIVFLCGGNGSARRNSLAHYLRQHTDALVFYAEDVWGTISSDVGADALQMEKRLAELADIVVIIVESAGTLAELGAFSLHPDLLRKLLPVVDSRYERDASFVNTGPLRSVFQQSEFSPAIFAPFEGSFLLCAGHVERRLQRVRHLEYRLHIADFQSNPKQLLVFVVALVALLYPVTLQHLSFVIKKVLGVDHRVRVDELLGLAVSLRHLSAVDLKTKDGVERFYCPVSFRRIIDTSGLDYAASRASIVGVLQRVPSALAVIRQLESLDVVAS